MTKKYGIDKLTASVRIYKEDWEKIAELASQRGCNLPDATHEIIQKGLKSPQNQPRNVGVVPIPGLIMEGNKIVGVSKPPQTSLPTPYCPFCAVSHPFNQHIKPLPELDAEGRVIPEY
jgi:hypothetical protein